MQGFFGLINYNVMHFISLFFQGKRKYLTEVLILD